MCWKVWINSLKTLTPGSMHWDSISVEACALSPISLPSIENLLRPEAEESLWEMFVAGREEAEQSIAKIQGLHFHHSPREFGTWGRCWVLTQLEIYENWKSEVTLWRPVISLCCCTCSASPSHSSGNSSLVFKLGIYSPMLSVHAVQVSWPQHTRSEQMSGSGLTNQSDCSMIQTVIGSWTGMCVHDPIWINERQPWDFCQNNYKRDIYFRAYKIVGCRASLRIKLSWDRIEATFE